MGSTDASSLFESRFTLTDEKTGKQTEVAYSEVKEVNGCGMGMGTKIAIIGGIGVGVLAIVVVVALKNFDPLFESFAVYPCAQTSMS